MTRRDTIDAARKEALRSLVGHDGIVGVGRTASSLVFFVRDAVAAHDRVEEWSATKGLPIEVQVVGGFRPAAS